MAALSDTAQRVFHLDASSLSPSDGDVLQSDLGDDLLSLLLHFACQDYYPLREDWSFIDGHGC